MPVTIVMYTEEPVATLDQSFADFVLHYIPFCSGKTFTGDSRYTQCVGRSKPAVTVLINDPVHHSDDLYMAFCINGGYFHYQNQYDHPINDEIAFWEVALGVKHSDPQFTPHGDIIVTFVGKANFIRTPILNNNQRASLKAVK